MESEPDEVLSEDGITHVVRIGSTVRRPVRPFTATVQSFLQHLWDQGMRCIPEPLGYDEEGREVLGYVEGEVPDEPVPGWTTTDDVLVALAQLIRRLHDAATGWEPPIDAVWGEIPGQGGIKVPPLFTTPELVAHQDHCPGNVVFRGGLPAALIDFDLARPTTRVLDCVNALYWWVPLLDPQDRVAELRDADVPHRCRVFADAYAMTEYQRAQVAPLALQRSRNSLVAMRTAAAVDPIFKRWWDGGVRERLIRAEAWLAATAEDVAATLLA